MSSQSPSNKNETHKHLRFLSSTCSSKSNSASVAPWQPGQEVPAAWLTYGASSPKGSVLPNSDCLRTHSEDSLPSTFSDIFDVQQISYKMFCCRLIAFSGLCRSSPQKKNWPVPIVFAMPAKMNIFPTG